MKPIAILLFAFMPAILLCQNSQQILVSNNTISSGEISPELQQIFPEFKKGSIHYKEKRAIECKLNYNFLLDEILFINEKNEIMAIANPNDLNYVIIENRKFIYLTKGYYEIIEEGETDLIYKWMCRISKTAKEGALGISTVAPSVYQMNRFSFDSKEWKPGINEEAVLTVEVKPYIRIKTKLQYVSDNKSFIRAHPEKRTMLTEYLEKYPVNYTLEEDLRRVTKYSNSIIFQ